MKSIKRVFIESHNAYDPFTSYPIDTIPDDELVTIPACNGLTRCLELLKNIQMEMTKEMTPHDVEVSSYAEMNGNMAAILSKNIWVEYLLMQHGGYQTFLSFYADTFDNIKNTEKTLKRLHSEETLRINVKLFHFDLTNFNNEISASRLVTDKIFFMSEYYFTDADRELLLSFPTSTGLSFQRHMELLLQQKKLEDDITELETPYVRHTI